VILLGVSMFRPEGVSLPGISPAEKFECGVYECGAGGASKCCFDVRNGPVCYNPTSYICANSSAGTILCGFSSGQFNGACGSICYDKARYVCDNREFLVAAADLNTQISPSGAYVGAFTTSGDSNIIVFPTSSQLPALTFSRSTAQKVIDATSENPVMVQDEQQVVFSPFAVFNSPSSQIGGVFAAELKFDYKYSGSPVSLDVVVTSCADESYDSCTGDSCYPSNGSSDVKLCPCNSCQILQSQNVKLSPSGTANVELGRVAFPLTISFSPALSDLPREAMVSGQATISNVALAF